MYLKKNFELATDLEQLFCIRNRYNDMLHVTMQAFEAHIQRINELLLQSLRKVA